jgi:hypothetical protein
VSSRRVTYPGREPTGRSNGTHPKLALARRLDTGERVNRPPHELSDGDVFASRSPPQRFRLLVGELNLRPDHAIMMTQVMA